ncbi:MAG: PQ-loop domain-containing transporter [Candidatus Saccharimonadales bacterium]
MAVRKNRKIPTKTAIIDTLVNIAAVIHPLSALPQVYTIYVSQNVAGVSLWTWLGFMVIGFIFLAYGLVHRLKPIIVTQILWFVVDALVIIGVLLYQ